MNWFVRKWHERAERYRKELEKKQQREWCIADPTKVEQIWKLYDRAVKDKTMLSRFYLWSAICNCIPDLPRGIDLHLTKDRCLSIIIREGKSK